MPGRARLRIAERRGDSVFFASVASGLSTIAGIYHAEVRPLTGSVLIEHGPPLDRIGAVAREARLFAIGNAASPPPPVTAAEIDPKMVVGIGLGAVAVWQLLKGELLPPAITLAWYAASLTGLVSNGALAEGHDGGD
ncbi:MAG: hypothetical protein P8Y53_17930 [Pseudolabrys sp.]